MHSEMQSEKMPLVVDLDGTLAKVDTLHEGLAALLCRQPWNAVMLLWRLMIHGRVAMKAYLAGHGAIDVGLLPLRTDFVAWLEEQARTGRPLHLVSAADQRTVEAVAKRLKVFTSWRGSAGTENLKGEIKAAYLVKTFPDGFTYAGDSAADLAVWRAAKGIVLVNASPSVARRAAGLGKPIEARFERKVKPVKALFKEFRLHQWSKNILVFLPILLAHHFTDTHAWLHVLYAFLALGILASATYIVNDLYDLEADRRHATKRHRPLASGALGVAPACSLVPFMLAAGFALAWKASLSAVIVLAVYLVLTLAYSFRLKRVPLLDTAVIGLLFTLRIVMGCAAADLLPSPWLLAFSVMLFFSLAMAKRQTEITKNAAGSGGQSLAGRGYHGSDVLLSLVYGVTSGVASLVILMLYTTNSVATGLYRHPYWLWGIPLLIYLWQMRVWLLAHRGILDDDPIVFALKDRVSLGLGAGCVIAFYLAL
jgi:4-hydroxybenzoate polyprenyltransferase